MLIKILVVDDSASDRLIIKNMLSEYTVLTACDGVEALRVLSEHDEINLLILDLNMPNMNGFQVLESLNQDERFRNLRTIILTNYDELDNEIKGLKLGAVDYIRKPIHMDSLKAIIDVHVALLQAQQALEQKIDEQALVFDMVFDQAPIGIAISHSRDPKRSDKNNIKINSAFEQITGRTKEELIDSGWAKITYLDDLDEDIERFNKLQSGEIKSYSMEKRYVKPDGSVVWVYMVVAAFAPNDENKINHVCLIQDITIQKAAMAAHFESEKKYQSITENMSDVVWQMDLNLKTTYVSPSVEKLLGESIEEHMNRKMEEKFPAQTLHKIQSIFYEELEKEKDPEIDKNRSRTIEVEHYKADGTVIWLELNISFIRDDNGNAVGFQGSARDITQRKMAEIALRENERRESILLSHLPGLAYRCKYNRDGTMLIVSNGCYALTGYLPECFINDRDLPFNDIIAPEYRDILWAEWERAIPARLPYKCEYEITTATGERKWVLEMGQGIYNDDGEVEALEGIILDISDRKEMENRLRYINEHDKWTGLYNHDYLEALLNNDIKKKDGLKRAVISINLSTVQLLTANYGFHYTQNLIKMAAETLSQYCSDTRLLFQTYENRFVFYLIDYKDKNELVEFSDVIAEALEALFVTERIGGGIGILEIEQDDDEIDVDLLLRRLLIASKRSIAVSVKDFDACFYNEELEAAINRETDIRKALGGIAVENTNDELFLHYQPILDLRTNDVCGFEALARLKTEKLGLVLPIEFIPIAEKTKMIIPIGEKVMINAFHFLNKLKASGYDEVGVAINVSAIQLFSPDFIRNLFELISEMQLNPKNIGIEITESVFASDYDYINSIIVKLRDAGIHIAIDDFGTGYSSLVREKELSVDCLKIDKYFIDKLLDADPSKAITSDIISMSHKLGHCTIAEGVEHECQLQYLQEHNCDRIQGYLFSKPLNEEDALEFLKSKRPMKNLLQVSEEAEIQYLNCYDTLAGLHNRKCFEDNRAKIDNPDNLPLSVIFADINGLKMTNDIFGHRAGDELIKKSSEILLQVCRQNDVVARVGGDEFIILLPNTTKENAEKILARIKSGFADARVEAIKSSIALGLDTKRSPDQLLDEIMANAENAMYMDKTMNRKSINKEIIGTIIETLHTRNPKEKQHSVDVSELCSKLGTALHLPDTEVSKLSRAGYLHDIGKIVLDEAVLNKETLSADEREKMQQHSVVGYRILNLFDDTLDLAEYVYGHHERWDGKGYPRGLKGEQIPLLSRIIAVTETYDRVLNRGDFPLKDRKQAALDVIKNGSGTQFDPQIAELFVQIIEKSEEV
jgi:diguanylate cyclase (GGDEF)-like protein/PAS domain S-box-containing protein/putative nucleotidyltransferase with HDIG domain